MLDFPLIGRSDIATEGSRHVLPLHSSVITCFYVATYRRPKIMPFQKKPVNFTMWEVLCKIDHEASMLEMMIAHRAVIIDLM